MTSKLGELRSIDVCGLVKLIRRLGTEGDLPAVVSNMELTADSRLEDLALDSLGRLCVIEEIETYLERELPEFEFEPSLTLSDFADLLNRI